MQTAVLGRPLKFIPGAEDWMGVGRNPCLPPIRLCPDDDIL